MTFQIFYSMWWELIGSDHMAYSITGKSQIRVLIGDVSGVLF